MKSEGINTEFNPGALGGSQVIHKEASDFISILFEVMQELGEGKEREVDEKTAPIQPHILEAIGSLIPLNLNSTSKIEEPLPFKREGYSGEGLFSGVPDIELLEEGQRGKVSNIGIAVSNSEPVEGYSLTYVQVEGQAGRDRIINLRFEEQGEAIFRGDKVNPEQREQREGFRIENLSANNPEQRFQKPAEPISLLENALKPKVKEDISGVKKQEERGDPPFFHDQPYRQERLSEDYQETRVEVIEKRPVMNQEPRHVSLRFEEANIRLNLLGERLKLFINLKEEAYWQPTASEVQRLVQSLQSLGYNLEVLRLNGSNLYSSEGRQGGKREEREKYSSDLLKNLSETSEYRSKSFSLYL